MSQKEPNIDWTTRHFQDFFLCINVTSQRKAGGKIFIFVVEKENGDNGGKLKQPGADHDPFKMSGFVFVKEMPK